MKYYAGIGSRRTPTDVLGLMVEIGRRLALKGYCLRSGHADGADKAFEDGCDIEGGAKEIYIPWPRFNGSDSHLCGVSVEALEMASTIHPAWDRCSQAARKLHARNCYQILGQDLNTPVEGVICWHDGTGGTTQACRIADLCNIRISNLFDAAIRARWERWAVRF